MDAPVVLVTGASSGTGLAAAVELAQRGARTYGTTRERLRAESMLVACERAGVAVEVIELDVRSESSVRDAADNVVTAEGRIDVLVNNAATVAFGPMEFTTVDDLHAMLETNLLGPIRMIQAELARHASPRPGPHRQHRLDQIDGQRAHAGLRRCVGECGAEGGRARRRGVQGTRAARHRAGAVRERSRFGRGDGAYAAVEDWTTAFAEFIEQNAPESTGSGALVANACLAPQPELRFPRAAQGLVDAAQQVSDDDYRRLCRGEHVDAAVHLPTGFMWKLRSSSTL